MCQRPFNNLVNIVFFLFPFFHFLLKKEMNLPHAHALSQLQYSILSERYKEYEYHLAGFVIHSGSMNSGHYSSVLRTSDGYWHMRDDTTAIPLHTKDMSHYFGGQYGMIYMAFYHRSRIIAPYNAMDIRPLGLGNPGLNVCHQNAWVQQLISNPYFYEKAIVPLSKYSKTRQLFDRKGTSTRDEIKDFATLWTDELGCHVGVQSDAMESFLNFLGSLKIELSASLRIAKDTKSNFSIAMAEVARSKKLQAKGTEIINSLFQMKFERYALSLISHGCKEYTKVDKPESTLELRISVKKTLKDSIDYHFGGLIFSDYRKCEVCTQSLQIQESKDERLELLACSKCPGKLIGDRKHYIQKNDVQHRFVIQSRCFSKLPPIFVIKLKEKKGYMDFPNILDLTPYTHCEPINDQQQQELFVHALNEKRKQQEHEKQVGLQRSDHELAQVLQASLEDQ